MFHPAEALPPARAWNRIVVIGVPIGQMTDKSAAVSVAPAALPETVIEAGRSEAYYWRDVWRYRDLLFFLSWRDLAVRYKQTVVGVAWALVQPGFTLAIFTIFGWLAKLPTDGAPRAVLVGAAVLPWQFFASALAAAGGSLVSNSNLVTKVYFPRLIIPASAIVTSLADFAIALGFYLVLSLCYRAPPDWRILSLPGFILLAMAVSFGSGLLITALTVKYRDFRILLPFIIQLGLYISPVAYPSSIIPANWMWLYRLNPMVGVIDGFRWSLLRGSVPLDVSGLLTSCVVACLLLAAGLTYFRSTERKFADFI